MAACHSNAAHLVHEDCSEALGPHNNANVSVIIQKQGLGVPLTRPVSVQIQQQAHKKRTPCKHQLCKWSSLPTAVVNSWSRVPTLKRHLHGGKTWLLHVSFSLLHVTADKSQLSWSYTCIKNRRMV